MISDGFHRCFCFYGFRRGKERFLFVFLFVMVSVVVFCFLSFFFDGFRLLQDRGCLSNGNRKNNTRTFPWRNKYIYIYICMYIYIYIYMYMYIIYIHILFSTTFEGGRLRAASAPPPSRPAPPRRPAAPRRGPRIAVRDRALLNTNALVVWKRLLFCAVFRHCVDLGARRRRTLLRYDIL